WMPSYVTCRNVSVTSYIGLVSRRICCKVSKCPFHYGTRCKRQGEQGGTGLTPQRKHLAWARSDEYGQQPYLPGKGKFRPRTRGAATFGRLYPRYSAQDWPCGADFRFGASRSGHGNLFHAEKLSIHCHHRT